jgi:hypothetical protein
MEAEEMCETPKTGLGFAGWNLADLLVGDLLIAVLLIDVSAPFRKELVVILGFEMLPA